MALRGLIGSVIEIVHLRQAGVPRASVEDHLVNDARLSRPEARRLVSHVEAHLRTVHRRMSLPLALSAEALALHCIEIAPKQPAKN